MFEKKMKASVKPFCPWVPLVLYVILIIHVCAAEHRNQSSTA